MSSALFFWSSVWSLTLTIILWFIGVPLMIVGAILCAVGRNRNTVIQNTVTYHAGPQPIHGHPQQSHPQQPHPQQPHGSYAPPNPSLGSSPTAAIGATERLCPSCNGRNSATGRFCNHCGAALVPQVT